MTSYVIFGTKSKSDSLPDGAFTACYFENNKQEKRIIIHDSLN